MNDTAASIAKQNCQLNLDALLGVRANNDEAFLRSGNDALREGNHGGGNMDDETPLSVLQRGLPAILTSAREDVITRDIDLSTAMLYLQRAENLAMLADGSTDHPAMVAHQRNKDPVSTSASSMVNRVYAWTTELTCHALLQVQPVRAPCINI